MKPLTIQNKKFYNDTYYNLEVRKFRYAMDNIRDNYGRKVKDQLELTHKTDDLNEYEKLYTQIIETMDKYCKHFVTLPVQNKNHVGLPIFLQLKKEHHKDGIKKILDELAFTDDYPFLLVDVIYKEDNSYPDELLPPTNQRYLFQQINNHYNQEIFDIDTRYFNKDGNLNLDKITLKEYMNEHTELLREDYK